MNRNLTMRVTFTPTLGKVAMAMALHARDTLLDVNFGQYEPEPPEFTEHVRAMSKADAMKALRSCYWAYGDQSWPEDVPWGAYHAALEQVKEWYA